MAVAADARALEGAATWRSSEGRSPALAHPMRDYMDLEAWGCPDDQDLDGKPCVDDLVTALADAGQRPEAVQALLADRHAAEDVVRSPAWPSFCACISALLSDPRPCTAIAGVTFLERVLEEACLSDAQSVAELFIALASHLRSTFVSEHHLPRAGSGVKPVHLPALNAMPAVPEVESGLSIGQDPNHRVGRSCDPQAHMSYKARTGSNLTAAVIAVDCRAAKSHLPGGAFEEQGSAALISAQHRHGGKSHSPEQRLHAGGKAVQGDVARQQTCQAILPNDEQMGGMVLQQSVRQTLLQMGEARARQNRLLGMMLEALPKLWVCLKVPMMQALWRSLSALMLVESRSDSMPAAEVAGTVLKEQHNSQQLTTESADLQSSIDKSAQDLQSPALKACMAGMYGPLVELSLAQETGPLHAKSWWQAWTLPISSNRWLPSALEESGVLPGILTCCYAAAHRHSRCKPTRAVEVLAIQILGTVLGLVQCRKLFPISVQLGSAETQVTCEMALCWLISIASRQYQQSGKAPMAGGTSPLGRSACEALHACLRSERAVTELLTQKGQLAPVEACQVEQLCCAQSHQDAGCASMGSTPCPELLQCTASASAE